MTTDFINDDFPIGTLVNVKCFPEDPFIDHDFTGHVKGYHGRWITVEDQDGDRWDCEPEQISYSSDDIMN